MTVRDMSVILTVRDDRRALSCMRAPPSPAQRAFALKSMLSSLELLPTVPESLSFQGVGFGLYACG